MRFKNSLSGEVEEFRPMRGKRVNMYVCGPTVQESFHIGHARTYIIFDSIAKYLVSSGYSLFYLQNITDIDDKIIKKANETNTSAFSVAEKYTKEYISLMHILEVDSINLYAKATEYVPEIISQVSRLMENGHAYTAGDGVYFKVSSFKDYGKLSNQRSEDLVSGTRVSENSNKADQKDFALWKLQKEGEPAWDSPWGKGRPGWHIEDTAITETYFGGEYDIHGGGSDLIFPHHEAEIAQMRSISGKDYLARYWIHTGMVTLNGEKMSKSLGNFITISDLLKKYNPREVRFAMLNGNYRSTIDFSDNLMEESRKNVHYLDVIYGRIKIHNGKYGDLELDVSPFIDGIRSAMDQDFNFRLAFTILMEMAGRVYHDFSDLSKASIDKVSSAFDWFNSFTGVLAPIEKSRVLTEAIDLILDLRRKLRDEKNYDLSDLIRKRLMEAGIEVQDNGTQVEWWIRD